MTTFALGAQGALLAVRFAYSPAWETLAAVQAFADERGRSYHEPWHRVVRERAARLDLEPLLAVQPIRGSIPDFLTPPPRTPRPQFRAELAAIRATLPRRIADELEVCRESVADTRYRQVLNSLLVDPATARDLLADCLHAAWTELIAPFWVRVRTLLERDIEERSRTQARHGLLQVLDELHPRLRWTKRGLSCGDHSRREVEVDERGLVLMPSAYVWPHLAAIVDRPLLPTLVYPARGIEELWSAPAAPPDAMAHIIGRTRALILANLDQPHSTTALSALIKVSTAGVSRHLLALRNAGLVSSTRSGHEVRYRTSELGSALLRAGHV